MFSKSRQTSLRISCLTEAETRDGGTHLHFFRVEGRAAKLAEERHQAAMESGSTEFARLHTPAPIAVK